MYDKYSHLFIQIIQQKLQDLVNVFKKVQSHDHAVRIKVHGTTIISGVISSQLLHKKERTAGLSLFLFYCVNIQKDNGFQVIEFELNEFFFKVLQEPFRIKKKF